MTDEVLSTEEKNALFALMAEAREISNPDLLKKYGLTLTGKGRVRLNDLKLVTSSKVGRTFVHELLDAGWARCREEILAPRTPRGGIAFYAVLAGLTRYLEQANLSVADIFYQPDGEQTPPVAAPPSTKPNLEARIRDVYQRLAQGSMDWVSLAKLRPLLGDVTKADVDSALKRMDRSSSVHLAPAENQKALSRKDRESAVKIGGQDNHLLLIEDL